MIKVGANMRYLFSGSHAVFTRQAIKTYICKQVGDPLWAYTTEQLFERVCNQIFYQIYVPIIFLIDDFVWDMAALQELEELSND